MNKTSETRIKWTNLIISLVLLCSMFGFNVVAQTDSDKPLDAKSLTNLVEELKGVVSRIELDEKNAALVAEKWDRRKDLAGKTKKEVINLLFEDVKSVIKDSGIHYQIYSIFSFYKQIPDKSFSAQAQKTNGAMSKPASINKLVELSYRMHPYVGIDEQLASLPGSADINAAADEERKNRITDFDNALKDNVKLTPAQKLFVRNNYEQLIKIADKITEDAIRTNFPTERWIKEGLQQSFTKKFSLNELTDLISYFQGTSGQQVLKYVRLSNMAELITGNGGKLDFTEADKSEHDKFITTPLGKKFIAAYLQDAIAYEQSKQNAVRAGNPDADGFAIYEKENLNKLFNKFVAENYKK